MRIGIIVHSKTGNTYSVARQLEGKLAAAGHSVSVERLIPADDKQTDPGKILILNTIDPSPYEALVFAAPVNGFSASAVMKAYLAGLPSIKGKKVACFVTKALPGDWTGGNQAISLMKSSAESRGGVVVGTAIVNWGGKDREKRIGDMVEHFIGLFK